MHPVGLVRMGNMDNTLAFEIFFLTLLGVASLAMLWFAVYVVWGLFKGQK